MPSEPRWPAILAIITTAIVYAALPDPLAVGPRWLLFLIVSILEIPNFLAHKRQWFRLNRALGYIVSAVLTLFLLWSLVLLILALPAHTETPIDMLRSAAALWVANTIIFAVWYWRLDAGGPTLRERRSAHVEGAFLFPQMSLHPIRDTWSPRFVDYLFIAFNTSTAFSPTDVPILSRWAKLLTMLQSLISLTIVILLAARAVNIM